MDDRDVPVVLVPAVPNTRPEPPKELLWLADAPLFIDAAQVSSFYDAVVAPVFKTAKVIDASGKEVRFGVAGKGGGEMTMELAAFLRSLFWFLPGLKGRIYGEASVSRDQTVEEQRAEEMVPVDTPQRQLLLLALHYVQLHQTGQHSRTYFVRDPSQDTWRTPEYIQAVPRSLIFLELPGQADAVSPLVPTMLIPTAAEFEGTGEESGVVELFRKMPGYADAGEYPEPQPGESAGQLRERRREYWNVFRKGFSATKAMVAVENAARAAKGRLRWIDYRLPITDRGDTLHLHCCPAGKYDTGVFAYNLIKRGFKHGLRLVGTLKSEPDMNVLAVYDR